MRNALYRTGASIPLDQWAPGSPHADPQRGRVHVLEREQLLDRPVSEVFAFFAEARNLERITPPFLQFEVLSPDPIPMRVGTLIEYCLRLHRVPVRWVTRIEVWETNTMFVDRQVLGPYSLWHHTHEFQAVGSGTLVLDRVRYAVPFGPLGQLARLLFVQRDLDDVFAYRRTAVLREFGVSTRVDSRSGIEAPLAERTETACHLRL
jgi:hypothetical protein